MRLAADPELRRRMGAAGRRLVEEHFNLNRWAPRFAALVRAAGVRAHLYPNAAWGITSVFPAGTQVYVVR